MEKYYLNKKIKENKSRIKKFSYIEEELNLVLEENIFFPGGGGQAADKGKLSLMFDEGINSALFTVKHLYSDDEANTVIVIDFQEKDLDKVFVGLTVCQFLDWEHRIDAMQQHTGQHLLSGCFFEKYGRNTISLHIGKDISQLDIQGQFDKDMIYEIEDMANRIIHENRKIKNYIINEEEKKSYVTRRPLPNTSEDIRILEIENLDINACCGVHCENTAELELIKIVRFYKHKENTRIEYLVGKRATEYVLKRDRLFKEIMDKYKSSEDTILSAIDNIELKKDKLIFENKKIMDQYTEILKTSYLEKIKINESGLGILSIKLENHEKNTIMSLANKLLKNRDLLLIISNQNYDMFNFLILVDKECSKKHNIKLSNTFDKIKEVYKLKGGGSDFRLEFFGQGKKNIDIITEYIYDVYWG